MLINENKQTDAYYLSTTFHALTWLDLATKGHLTNKNLLQYVAVLRYLQKRWLKKTVCNKSSENTAYSQLTHMQSQKHTDKTACDSSSLLTHGSLNATK